MDGITLQDRINRGMGVAARRIGSPYTVYRPAGPVNPILSRNFVISLSAAFSAGDDNFRKADSVGRSQWLGVFDAAYTLPGDYLVGRAGVFFIASQVPLLPVQCVKTNRVVTVTRPAPPAPGGYSGLISGAHELVLRGWPASVLALTTRVSGNLPETRFGSWNLLLPLLPVSPQAADVVSDDTGRNFVVGSAEQSGLGWRLTLREVAG